MTHRAFPPVALLYLVLAAFLCVSGISAVTPASAAPDDKKDEKPKGPLYTNKQAGVTARGPAGWRMKADESGPVEWSRLVTFYDPSTDADVVFSVRKKTTNSITALLSRVTKEWQVAKGVRITTIRKVESSPMVKVAHVMVDGGFVKRPKAKKGQDPSMRPPPVPYRISATYYLGPDGEYLLYAKAQDTHWSRLQGKLRSVRDSIGFAKTAAPAPTAGQNAYRNDKFGFTCTFPSTSSVHVSKYANQIVGFVPHEGSGVKIEVYRLSYGGGIDGDAKRMVTFYEEDQAGQVESSSTTVAGKEAALISAKADIGGVSLSMRVAIFERGDGQVWRIKVTGPAEQDAAVNEGLKTFVDSFKLTNASNN